ncbi:MAG: arginase family protein [Deltaproteobacteria bacterium]|nr:arginase family protein [Deltaproteobacteria bacterium]
MSTLAPLDELQLLLRPAGGGLYLVSTGAAEQKAIQRRYYGKDNDSDVTEAFLANLARVADKSTRVVVMGIPSDTGAGFRRGANLGPQALRNVLLEKNPDLQAQQARDGVVDVGDVFVVPQLLSDDMLSEHQLARARCALYPDVDDKVRSALPVSPLSMAERAWQLLFALNPAIVPMTLGGDHSTAWPAVKALHDSGKRFCILQFDAHTDLLSERLGVKMCFATWSFHANNLIGRHQLLVQVGIRATRHPKTHWEGTLDVVQKWAIDVMADPEKGIDDVVAAVKATGLPCFLSNDIDGTDAAVASACGTPEPAGLSIDVVDRIIERVGREVGYVGADLMEVAPLLEEQPQPETLATAARYLSTTFAALRPRS